MKTGATAAGKENVDEAPAVVVVIVAILVEEADKEKREADGVALVVPTGGPVNEKS